MRSPRKHILYFICALLFVLPFRTTGQQYSFINYSIEDGLAQSQVQTIFQDDKGYMWLGTNGGLTRYDGKNFVNYSREDGLLDNHINYITENKRKEFYVATLGGINKFDGKNFKGIQLRADLSQNQVTSIAFDRNGDLWLSTDGGGVCRYNGSAFSYYSEKDGLINNNVRSVCVDNSGNIWFGTRTGICYYDGKEFRRIDSAIAQPHNVSQVMMDRDKHLWFSTYGEGVYRYDFSSFTNYTEKDGLIFDWIRGFTQDSSGNFWFVSKRGVSKFDGEHFLNFNKTNGLFYSNLNTVMQDNEGKVWLGTDGKGVLKFAGERFVSYTTQDGLSNDIIMSIMEDNNGNHWFCTYGGGVCRQNAADNTFTRYTTDEGLSNNIVWTCAVSSNNDLWFGTSNGVCIYDGKKFAPLKDSLPEKTIYSIYRDSKGNMWLGTFGGVSVYDGKSWKNFVHGKDNIGKNIRCIVEDSKHNMWFAGSDGIYRYDGSQFVNYTTADGLSDNNVITILPDNRQNLWIGTSNGISLYDGKKFITIQVDKKYNANNINFLLLDTAQQLWAGTNNGIYELDTKLFYAVNKLDFRHYTNYEGLRSLECNQNAVFRDRSGNLWFGTSEGVIRYSPWQEQHTDDVHLPLTHITGIRLFLQPTDWSAYSDSTDSNTGLPCNLSIDYKKKYLTFDYIGISLSNPNAVRYRFKLEGFDQDWSPPTDATFATYSNIPYGKYTFKVIASNNNDWSAAPSSFSFEIRPPFWMTWWFFVLAAAFSLTLIWLLYKWRVSSIRQKHHTQQLEFQSKLLVLEHQTLNASMNRHFVFNALNSIQYYITKEDKGLATKYLSSFAKLIRKNLDSSFSTFVPLSEEIERLKLYLELEHMRLENKFEFHFNIEGDIDTDSIEIPPMMLQPYIENSIWHGILPMQKPGSIVISVKETEEYIMFSIEDNGIGIEASKAKKKNNGSGHISRGMEITTGRINLLKTMTHSEILVKGPFDVKNEKGEITGARVEIVLPIKPYS